MNLVSFLTAITLIAFPVFVLLTIPTLYALMRHYRKTSLVDYLILFLVFLSNTLNAFSAILFSKRDPEGYDLVSPIGRFLIHVTYVSGVVFIFLHCLRLQWQESPKKLVYPVLIMVILLILLLPFRVWYYAYYRDHLLKFYRYLGNIFRVYVFSVCIYAYLLFEPSTHSKAITRTKIAFSFYMILNGIAGLAPLINLILNDLNLYHNSVFDSISNLQLLIGPFALIIVIAVFLVTLMYPESILISHAQVSRIYDLYQKVTSANSIPGNHWKFDQLREYIANIPPSVFNE